MALATCDTITAEQIVSEAEGTAEAWLIDPWGSTHPLTSPAVIGRSVADCNPAVLHPSVSVLHAEIQRSGDAWRVVDRGSLNGTQVNDATIRTMDVSSGDRLRFGEVSFYFSAGELPAVSESGKTGATLPSRAEDLALQVIIELDDGVIELLQRPGGGIVRRAGENVLELAQLEFGLLNVLVRARQRNNDPELAFVSSRDLASELEFKSRQADTDNVRELVRRVRKKLKAANVADLIDSRQRVGYRIVHTISPSTSR